MLPRGQGGPGSQQETGKGSAELEQGKEIAEGGEWVWALRVFLYTPRLFWGKSCAPSEGLCQGAPDAPPPPPEPRKAGWVRSP